MAVVTMKQLLESGVHFGHQTRRWNPKMAPYIFTSRKDIHIIDLKRTAREIEVAYEALFNIVKDGGRVLFVGTKKQAQEAVKEEAVRAGQFYVDNRWLGGTLTNFKTIRRRIQLLHDLYAAEEAGNWERLPKKEVAGLVKTREKLEKFLGGIKEMQKLPQAMYVVDPRTEEIAVAEARKLGIPVFGIVDTNCDPDLVDYIIPANDDAIRAVKLITWVMANACVEAQGGAVEKYDDAEAADTSMSPQPIRKGKPAPRTARAPETASREQYNKPNRDASRPAPRKADPVKVEKPEAKKESVVKPEVKAEPKKVEPVKVEKEASAKVAPKAETKPAQVTIELESLKVAELRELAKVKEVKNYSTLRKAELIEALKN